MRARFLRSVAVAAGVAGTLWCQPFIPRNAVLNSASYVSPGLPGGAIARGSMFSIFGSALGPSAPVQVSAFPLQTALAGVSVRVFQGATAVDALPVFVSQAQLNVIMPSNAPLGRVSVQVTYNGVKSNPAPVNIAPSSFGIFAANSAGSGPGIVQNFNSAADQPVNSLIMTARPGQIIILWGTGLGPANGADNVAPTAGDLPIPVEVYVGGKLASNLYSGRTPCCSSIDQIVVRIPDDSPSGCYVPVQVRTNGMVTSNTVTMAIDSAGRPCTDSGSGIRQLVTGGAVGALLLVRGTMHADLGVTTPLDFAVDTALLSFWQAAANERAFHPMLSLPPAGACMTYTALRDQLDPNQASFPDLGSGSLDAGIMATITGPAGSKSLLPASPVSRLLGSLLGTSFPNTPPALFLDPGAYAVTGSGGGDIGPFSASVSLAPPITWSNRDLIQIVNRQQPLVLNWTGADPGTQVVAILGGNVDVPTNSTSWFGCLENADAGTFSVPSLILSAVAPSRMVLGQQKGFLFVGAMPAAGPQSFTARGLAAGLAQVIALSGKTVLFQ
jgi:uncharacterized protein (TIGR03437 family)